MYLHQIAPDKGSRQINSIFLISTEKNMMWVHDRSTSPCCSNEHQERMFLWRNTKSMVFTLSTGTPYLLIIRVLKFEIVYSTTAWSA